MITVNFSFSQTDSTEKKNLFVIKTDILLPSIWLILGNKIYSLSSEFGFNNRHSFQLTGLKGIREDDGYDLIRSSYLIEDYKYFLKREKQFAGFYTGVYSDQIWEYAFDSDNNILIEYKTLSVGGGPIFGYQNYFRKRITFDFIFGFGRSYIIDKKIIRQIGVGSIFIPPYWPDLRLAFNIGYRF